MNEVEQAFKDAWDDMPLHYRYNHEHQWNRQKYLSWFIKGWKNKKKK